MESSPSPCKLDHGGLEPNAVAIYEEVMYRMLPLIHSSQYIYIYVDSTVTSDRPWDSDNTKEKPLAIL